MSYNGSGTFQINSSGQPVVTGTVISSTAFNALTADLATGLSTAITKDGQTTTTARIAFAQGVSSTLTTDATSATTGSIITAGGISTQKSLWVGTTANVAGTTDATSATTGSIITAGGISCQKQAIVGTNLGIGGAPSNQALNVFATSTGTTSSNPCGIRFYDNGYSAALQIVNRAGQAQYNANSHVFLEADVEVARFTTAGWINVGYVNIARHLFKSPVTNTEGDVIFSVNGSSNAPLFGMDCAAGSYNTVAAAIWVGKNSANNRSINAGGTINASGADYAEYMYKADNCGTIIKGAIVGVDVDGKLTDKHADAHSFVIKSTNPSYVGGDVWGNEAVLGEHPKINGKLEDETDEDHKTRITAFEAALEVERQKVDRIAFSGQVPVNVTGATVGDYIVPVAGPDGGIAGEAVTNPTFDQYRAAVGRVWKILEDGRAFVSVKVS